MIRSFGAGLAVLAVAGMAVPAEAGDRKPRRHHRDRGDKVDAGDIAIGAVLLGVLALATSGKKKRAGDVPVGPAGGDAPPGGPLDADGAAQLCAQAAETQGLRLAKIVRTDRIASVEAVEDGGWSARGMLVLRDDYRESGDARMRGFRCLVADAGMPRVTFDGDPPSD